MRGWVSFDSESGPGVGLLDDSTITRVPGLRELGRGVSAEMLDRLAADPGAAMEVASVRLRAAVPDPGKVICVGLNYRSHIAETGRADVEYPVLFTKFASSLVGPYDDIVAPPESTQVDYEGELAVVIGASGRRIREEDASAHVLGYSVANDVTMRDYQYKTHQWLPGKSWDASTPLGPAVVPLTDDRLRDAGIRTMLNGEVVQESDLSMLIFSIPTLIATISEFTTLHPGDVILTGTPGGVGFRRAPQLFLQPGDTVRVEIDGLGAVENLVRAESTDAGAGGGERHG